MVQPRMLVVVLVTGIAAGAVSKAAQSPPEPNVPQTLEQYLREAARRNAGLQAAFEQWTAAVEQVPQAKALPDPRFSYGYFVEQINTRQQAGIMQAFPWFGKIAARTDAAAAAAKAAQQRFESRRLQLFYQVKDAFYEYAYLADDVRITREGLELLRHFEAVAQAKHLTAAESHPDVVQAQIEVVQLQNELRSWEESRTPLVAKLNAMLNRPAETLLPWPQRKPGVPVKLDPQALGAALREHNSELRAMSFEIEQRDREADLARLNFYPDLGVGAQWMSMAMNDRGSDQDVTVGIELNVPLWQSSYRAGQLQARALARWARHERRDRENDLLARTRQAIYDIENDQRWAVLYAEALVPKAQELIAVSEAAYLAGTIDFLRLLDAERTLLQFRRQRERFWASQQQRLAELEMLLGTDLPSGASAPVPLSAEQGVVGTRP